MNTPINLMELDLNWNLAAKRFSKDIRDDFWPDALGFKDLFGSEGWLRKIQPVLEAYKPRTGASYYIPKSNLTIRHSIHVSPIDRLVYQALIDKLIVPISPHLSTRAFSHRFRGPNADYMFQSSVQQWKAFHTATRSELQNTPGTWLVSTDVANYFECIRFRDLNRQFEHLLGHELVNFKPVLQLLMKCLSSWSPYDGYGIMQGGVDASAFLGNVLLDYVDRMMAKDGHSMFRYMDDMRIVAHSQADARRALVRLATHLRDIGLFLNSGKTHILSPESEKRREHLFEDDPEVDDIEEAIASKDRGTIQAIVLKLFDKTEQILAQKDQQERILKFCLNRIASLRAYSNLDFPDDATITEKVLSLLVTKPADTDTFCRYLEVSPLQDKHHVEIARLLWNEPLCVYPWQNYQLWKLAAQKAIVTTNLTRRAHEVLSAGGGTPDVGGAALYLGQCGDYADRQALRKGATLTHGLVKRCVHIAIQELHKAERNVAFQELSDGDTEAGILSEHLRSLGQPLYVANPRRVGIEELKDVLPTSFS